MKWHIKVTDYLLWCIKKVFTPAVSVLWLCLFHFPNLSEVLRCSPWDVRKFLLNVSHYDLCKVARARFVLWARYKPSLILSLVALAVSIIFSRFTSLSRATKSPLSTLLLNSVWFSHCKEICECWRLCAKGDFEQSLIRCVGEEKHNWWDDERIWRKGLFASLCIFFGVSNFMRLSVPDLPVPNSSCSRWSSWSFFKTSSSARASRALGTGDKYYQNSDEQVIQDLYLNWSAESSSLSMFSLFCTCKVVNMKNSLTKTCGYDCKQMNLLRGEAVEVLR